MTHFHAIAPRCRICMGVILALVSMLLLVGCVVGPHYVRPSVPTPPAYKESGATASFQTDATPNNRWQAAQPEDQLSKGTWWAIFGDPELNALEAQINVSNQTLKAQQAQYMQARALVRFYRADYLPTVTAAPSGTRTRLSGSRAVSVLSGQTYNDFVLPFDVSYEPDVWGRVRRTVEAARENAQASAADLRSASLSLHAELATDYFQLRGLDAEEELLNSTVAAYQEALHLTLNRFHGGVASEVDVDQAQTQLETTRAQATDVQLARVQYEHAIATLLGKPASSFSLPVSPLHVTPPVIPAGLPSQLLERRPDIAAAERTVASANEEIGVAKTAYYPNITLAASGGLESATLGTLLNGPSALWSVGAAAVQTIFDGGRRHALSEQAWAVYDQNVAAYRQTVLNAFQDVEDNLAAQRILQSEAVTQDYAVAAAQRSLSQSIGRYRGGVTTYLEVTTAQSAALANRRTAVQIMERRMTAAVLLIKALGGGWKASF